MSDIAIHVDNVSFEYEKGDVIIKDVSFSIEKNATAMIIGPNGSGKTTLLKALVGLLEPSHGNIAVLGTSLAQTIPCDCFAPTVD